MELILASHNQNKVLEIAAMLPIDSSLIIKSLSDINYHEEIAETQNTLEGNATQKSEHIFNLLGVNVFSEDTGLEIDTLNGEPGVITARYGGPERDADRNMDLVLKKLDGKQNRNARFRTIISLILDGKETQFEGINNGRIALTKAGSGGFGYDPIFIPDGFNYTSAQLPIEVKYGMSHRTRALEKMLGFLLR